MGEIACDSSEGENTDSEYIAEQHEYGLRKQVVSSKERFISKTKYQMYLLTA